MTTAIYAGSFDPPTLGHLDIIKRGKKVCDRLVVAIGVNPTKQSLFSVEERLNLLEIMITQYVSFTDATDIVVASFPGLLVDYAKAIGAKTLIRGVRSATDFDYESNLAVINKGLEPEIETVFLAADPKLAAVSSTATKMLAQYGRSLDKFVPRCVEDAMKRQFLELKNKKVSGA